VAEALHGAHFPGRERDEDEVRRYYRALEHVAALVRGRVADGLLEVHEPARKTRSYRLSPLYEDLVT
jgi:hypothetical protein